MKTPLWIRKILAPLVSLKSPMWARWMLDQDGAETYKDLKKLNKQRLDLIGEILQEWDDQEIDAMIIPGFVFPAPLLGYPSYLQTCINYTATYNSLNFPVGSVPVRILI